MRNPDLIAFYATERKRRRDQERNQTVVWFLQIIALVGLLWGLLEVSNW